MCVLHPCLYVFMPGCECVQACVHACMRVCSRAQTNILSMPLGKFLKSGTINYI